jgi:phosphatidate cytidylyltransferase
VMAVVIVISGTLGDLVESMIKRSIGVKDSGRFMPGHGGLLDRFDSILLAVPVIYFVLEFFR